MPISTEISEQILDELVRNVEVPPDERAVELAFCAQCGFVERDDVTPGCAVCDGTCVNCVLILDGD